MRIFVDIYKMDIQNIFNIKRVLVVKLWSPLNHLDISEGRLHISQQIPFGIDLSF